ncbi:MAG: M20/M25/M40 family metallo-hydrolase [Butyricicoccus pullicaecorum]|nr:M20/M25/M40 family metallo-hydrolase [Butyricicoccus pullicaecorum]
MSKVFEYYSKVGGAFGPSGREDDVREVIGALAADYCDEIQTDTLGNLICHKKGAGENRKKLLFAAHMDTLGVVATCIDEKGFVRFSQVGGLSWTDLINIQVKFANGTHGVISFEEKTPWKDMNLSHLFIDVGARNRESAKVRVGDFGVFSAPTFEQDGVLCGPYLDNRIGCVALLMAMEQLPETVEDDLYFVFTVQEEVGLRGAGPAAFAIEPDIVVAVDVTDTGDLPEHKYPMDCHMGEGPAIKIMDSSVICSPEVVHALDETAAKLDMQVQHEVLQFGGTDTSMLQKTAMGALAGAVSIPTRYIHSPSEMCSTQDVAQAAKLIAAFAAQKHEG